MLLLMASPLISALVVTRAAPTAVVAPTLARSCDVAAAVRTQQRAAVVMMGRGGGQREERPRKEKVAKDVLELDGTVLESLPNAMFRVQLMDSEQARTHAHSRAFPTWVACTPHAHTPCDPIERGTHTLVAGDSRPHLGQDPQELHQDPGTPTPTAIASTTVPSTPSPPPPSPPPPSPPPPSPPPPSPQPPRSPPPPWPLPPPSPTPPPPSPTPRAVAVGLSHGAAAIRTVAAAAA